MGNSKSKPVSSDFTSSTIGSAATTRTEEEDHGRNPNEMMVENPTTAVVIGGGFSGIHCARELSKLGFAVTVIDENEDVAMGATKYSHGTFGAAIPFRNGIWSLSTLGEMIVSAFPHSARTLIGSETAPWEYFRFPNWRFAYTRTKLRATDAQFRQWTTFLADENESVMAQLMEEHPELKRCIIAQQEVNGEKQSEGEGSSATGGEAGSDRLSASAQVAAPKELVTVIDPVKWTRTLRDICERTHHVKFIYGRPVLRMPFRLAGGCEYSPNIVLKAPDDEDGNPMNYVLGYDVVVIAAGAGSADLTWNSYPLPMLPLAGYGVDFKESNPLFKSALEKTRESAKNILHIGNNGFLRLSPISPADEDASSAEPAKPDWRLSGLLSFANTFSNYKPTLQHALDVLRPRLRLQAEIDIPDYVDHVAPAVVEEQQAPPIVPEESLARPFSFTRGFTADGLPIISRLGNARNVFVCTGFGDDTVMFAAGAAKVLTKLMTHKLDEDGNPFGMKRFKCYTEFDQSPYWSWPITLYSTESALGLWGSRLARNAVQEASSYPLVRYWLGLDLEME